MRHTSRSMYDFQRRSKIRKRIYSRTSLVLLAVITVLLARGAYGMLQKERQSNERVERLQAELAEAEEKHAELSEDISYLETRAGVEREIRDRFSVSKEGEEMIVIVNKEPEKSAEVKEDKGLLGDIADWFKDLF